MDIAYHNCRQATTGLLMVPQIHRDNQDTKLPTCLSKRPGLIRALSKMSALLVAAMTMMPVLPSKPSISVSSWFRVCSRSSLPPPTPVPRDRPTASISSTKTMHGAFSLAYNTGLLSACCQVLEGLQNQVINSTPVELNFRSRGRIATESGNQQHISHVEV